MYVWKLKHIQGGERGSKVKREQMPHQESMTMYRIMYTHTQVETVELVVILIIGSEVRMVFITYIHVGTYIRTLHNALL